MSKSPIDKSLQQLREKIRELEERIERYRDAERKISERAAAVHKLTPPKPAKVTRPPKAPQPGKFSKGSKPKTASAGPGIKPPPAKRAYR
jgi:hypothetical protein